MGSYYYSVFVEINSLFVSYGIEPLDLESHVAFMEFISIKAKTSHVFSIHEFLKQKGFDFSNQIGQLFIHVENEKASETLFNFTTKTEFEWIVENNTTLRKFMKLFIAVSTKIAEENPRLRNIQSQVDNCLSEMKKWL